MIKDISFKRNAINLISRFDISFSNEIVDRVVKENIVNKILFVPNIKFRTNWEGNILSIFPDSVLEELTKYELHVGDNETVFLEKYNFITGPYLYYTDEFFIKPEHWEIHYKINVDGIPEVYYEHIEKWQVNPCTIAQYALACYDDYIWNENEISKEVFMKQVKYLIENFHVIDGKIAFPYLFPFRNLQYPWYSGIAQGQIVSVLVRAYIITDDKKYLDLAEKIVAFMFVPVEKGGIFTFTPEGHEWIEEFPATPSSFVWNGFVFAVMGLIDYNKICPNSKIAGHINKFILSIKETINIYDTGKELYYERLNKNICDLLYTGLQTYQVRHLYFSTKDIFFKELYEKWKKYFIYDETFLSLWNSSPKKLGYSQRRLSKYVPKIIKRIIKKIICYR